MTAFVLILILAKTAAMIAVGFNWSALRKDRGWRRGPAFAGLMAVAIALAAAESFFRSVIPHLISHA